MTRASYARRARYRPDRIDWLFKQRVEADGDYCTLCRRPFAHRDATFYGSALGVLALTGNCCAEKLDSILAVGFYHVGQQ